MEINWGKFAGRRPADVPTSELYLVLREARSARLRSEILAELRRRCAVTRIRQRPRVLPGVSLVPGRREGRR